MNVNYFDRLNNIEQQILRLDQIESILRVAGDSEAKKTDLLNVTWILLDMVQDINKNLSKEFYDLYEEVRQSEFGHLNNNYKMKVGPELTDIVNKWIRSEGC